MNWSASQDSGVSKRVCVFATTLLFFLPSAAIAGDRALQASALVQMQELLREKNARTHAQKKIDSHLLFHLKRSRGELS